MQRGNNLVTSSDIDIIFATCAGLYKDQIVLVLQELSLD